MDPLLKYKIAITMLPGIGGITARKLISYCGSLEGVFQEKESALLKIPGVGKHLARMVKSFNLFDRVDAEIEFIERNQIRTFFYTDKDYPARLKHCEDGPVLLFYKGTADLNAQRVVGIVGTRNITEYGKSRCKEIVEGLRVFNPLIVSGLAYGVDAKAHKSALEVGLPTVGVLGHGLDRVYPQLHKNLAQRMVDEGGGLLSDFISETQPDRENFPKRNRIIAGLVDTLVVVEAATTGGALITANIANSYDRDVVALPGRTDDLYSQGCNLLIKTHKAHLVENAADIAYVMGWEEENGKPAGGQQQLFVDLNDDETRMVEILKEHQEASFDYLVSKSGLSFSKTSALLLNLEFKGVLKVLPGRMFRLNGRY